MAKEMNYKLGSLFDGSGGFPLAGTLCGIEPVWAAEVEPYPIAVTRERFPKMKHLGDIRKVNGADIEPVNIITFGSPCQDLSVAGKRAGLKHEANGDEKTTRSGLFMDAVRIIKEMRKATNGMYPRFALWENVPGAFSSNKGEDFRIVCEELIKIVEPTASMPAVPQKGWNYADSYIGDGWSLAYRVFDAQYWGVPQRRRRIHLVADFRGTSAREVLFERQGVRGYFTQGTTPWQDFAANAQGGTPADDRAGEDNTGAGGRGLDAVGFMRQLSGVEANEGLSPTLLAAMGESGNNKPCVAYRQGAIAYSFDSLASNSMKSSNPHSGCREVEVSKTLDTTDQNPSKNQGGIAVVESIAYDARGNGDGKTVNTLTGDHENWVTDYTSENLIVENKTYQEKSGPLMANSHPGSYTGQDAFSDMLVTSPQFIVRRLTPTECARLQGFADCWGDIEPKDDFTDDEYQFWLNVRNTHAAINGKTVKEYTKAQMLTWYNKLHTDSSEYKMWGNGIALPPALYCMQGITDVLNAKEG